MPTEIKTKSSNRSGTPFLTVAEIAHQLGLSERRVYQLIDLHLLPAVRLGRSVRVPQAAWAAWLVTQEKQALASIKGSMIEE